MKYRACIPLNSRVLTELYRGLDVVQRQYNKVGIKIVMIHYDEEFKPLMNPVADDMDVDTNYFNPDDHVPDIERNNRVVKERFRISYYRLPFQKIPRVMIHFLAMVNTKTLNLFPVKHRISVHFSPHMLMMQRKFDYKNHCVCKFDTYVQASQVNDPNNINLMLFI